MLQLVPFKSLTLDHRAHYLRRAAAQPLFAAASGDGDMTVFRLDSEATLRLRSGWRKINAMSPHPSEPVLAIVGGERGTLRILGLDGSVVFEATPGFDDCFFAEDGSFLWCSVPISKDEIEVQIRETRRWSIVAKTVVEDPFGGSSASFHCGVKGEITALWLAAGQDGQQVYWATKGPDWCSCVVEPCLQNTIPPAFCWSGREFLVVGENRALRRYKYPPGEPIGTCESPEGEADPFADRVCYLDDSRALAKTNNGRIFLVDVASMHILDEVAIEGHEPRPVEHYHPSLRGDMQLCTDISYFVCLGEMLVFVARSKRGFALTNRKVDLMFVQVSSFL